MLERHHLSHICVVEGGYYAIHECLHYSQRMDWLVDHVSDHCTVCAYYRMSHTFDSLVNASINLASKASSHSFHLSFVAQRASKAFTTLQQKTQAVLAKPETGLESVSELSEKGKSLLSKAFMWTREKSASLMEEVAKKVNAVSEAEQMHSTSQQVDQSVFTVDEYGMIMTMSVSDEEDVFYERTKVDKSLLAMITDLKPGQRFEESGFVHGGGLVYDVDSVSLTECVMTEVMI